MKLLIQAHLRRLKAEAPMGTFRQRLTQSSHHPLDPSERRFPTGMNYPFRLIGIHLNHANGGSSHTPGFINTTAKVTTSLAGRGIDEWKIYGTLPYMESQNGVLWIGASGGDDVIPLLGFHSNGIPLSPSRIPAEIKTQVTCLFYHKGKVMLIACHIWKILFK